MRYQEYPENEAVLIRGNCSIVRHSTMGHYCGYCRLPRLVAEPGSRGFLSYVPVHGGITYARASEHTDQMIYGFDCMHVGDETSTWWHDTRVVLEEAQKMSTAIKIAAAFEPFYLLTKSNRIRSYVIGLYHRALHRFWGIEFSIQDNFGTMMNLICGEL